jgi:cystathionine beta-lyase family protein involved in aluminum resistance
MNVQKKIEKFQKRYDNAESGQTVKVIEFKRKHFKDTLSTSVGFGYQDMKEDAKDFFKWMINEDIEFDMIPSTEEDFSVLVNTVKCDC